MSRSRKDGRHHGGHRRSREFWSRNIGKAKGCAIQAWAKRLVSKLVRRQGKIEVRNAWEDMSDEEYNRLTNYGAF